MPTPAGLDLLEHVRGMGDAASRVSLTASGHSQSLAGKVSITAGELYAARLLPGLISGLRREWPGLEIEIVATGRAIDLNRHEADIAIRNFRPTQPELVARQIGEDRARLYASPDYLARIGNPATPAALSRADFIGFDAGEALAGALAALGLTLVPHNFPVLSASPFVQLELARAGAGIAVAPEWLGDAEPGLVRAVPDLPPLSFPVWLTAHRDLKTSRRVRLVHDRLAAALAQILTKASRSGS